MQAAAIQQLSLGLHISLTGIRIFPTLRNSLRNFSPTNLYKAAPLDQLVIRKPLIRKLFRKENISDITGDFDFDSALEDTLHKILLFYFLKKTMVCTVLVMSGKRELPANTHGSTNIPQEGYPMALDVKAEVMQGK